MGQPLKKQFQHAALFAALPSLLVLVSGSARAQSAAPGYVDLAEHMRKMDAAAKVERCVRENAKKKKRDRRYKPVDCDPEASANRAAAAPPLPIPAARPSLPPPAPEDFPPLVAAPRAPRAPVAPVTRPAPLPIPPPAPVESATSDDPGLVTRRRVYTPPAAAAPAPAPQAYSQRIIEPHEPGPAPWGPAPEAPAARDEGVSSGRPLRGGDELLAGGGAVSNSLTFGGDVAPDSFAIAFTWRALSAQDGGLHNLLLLRFGGAPCAESAPCGVRASGLIGFSPEGRSTFQTIDTGTAHTDSLQWSSLHLGFALKGRFDSGFGLETSARLESLSMSYLIDSSGHTPVNRDGSLGMLTLAGGASYARGGVELRVLLADTLYFSGDASQSSTAPLRGVFYDPELFGLASAPEGFLGKLEARYVFSVGFSAQVSYGFLGYAGPVWSSASVLSAQLGQELGRFQLGLGLSAQLDSLAAPAANQGSLASVFFGASLATHFN